MFFFEYLIDETMLNVDPAGTGPGKITDQSFIRWWWWILKRVGLQDGE